MIAAAPTLPAAAGAGAGNHGADAGQKATTEAVCAVASCSRSRCKWPPARWPVSCANTPMISFGVRGVEQRAGVDEDVAAVHDEGVEGAVVEHHHPDVLFGEAGRAQNRRGVIAQQLLDFGVADDRHAARGASCACAGASTGPPAAAATAMAVANASARPAGAMRHALVGGRCSIMPTFATGSREPSDAPRGGQRSLRSRLSSTVKTQGA